ncbi:MAG: ABC transporter permease [Betaproteobacteria bacterium]|nr:MAG: ABC transporter permease [Betaproteobacteria bacterium]RPI48360.1 MAG: ABC transporter permease [Betaproteobacteria bacterium]
MPNELQQASASGAPPLPGTARVFFRKYPPLVLAAGSFVVLVLLISALADLLAPYHYTTQDLANRLRPPAFLGGLAQYPLGTDELGRDILSRLLYATRFSVIVAILGTSIGAVVGTLLGFVAAHFRGWVDETLMMLVDAQASLPFMLLALAVLAFFGNNLTLFILVLGINGWENYARLSRGMVLSASRQGYAVAVHALGASPARIYGRHILPNILSVLIVQFTLNFPQTILLETSMSFLGLGIQPPLTSLGQMLGAGRKHLLLAWWIAVLPGLVIFLTTLSISIFGDWLRDRLDPTLRNR